MTGFGFSPFLVLSFTTLYQSLSNKKLEKIKGDKRSREIDTTWCRRENE